MWDGVNSPFHTSPRRNFLPEAVHSSGNTLKLTLPHKAELHVPVQSKGMPNQFLVHDQQAINAITQKDVLVAYEKAIKDHPKLSTDKEAMTNCMGVGEDANTPKAKAVQKAEGLQGCSTHYQSVVPALL